MLGDVRRYPPLVILTLIACAMMQIPMLYALVADDLPTARAFFYHGAFFAVLACMVGIAVAGRRRLDTRYALVRLLAAYLVLPIVLAAPVAHLVAPITFSQAWFEMLSCLTTTGATLLPAEVPDAVHLWRALVAWMGGFLVLVVATAILEPLQLGGFEIETAMARGVARRRPSLGGSGEAGARIVHHVRTIFPAYGIFTLTLAIGLLLAGDPALVAICHAMAVLSTSAVSPLPTLGEAPSGYPGEGLIFVFLFLAISRRPLAMLSRREPRRIDADRKSVV